MIKRNQSGQSQCYNWRTATLSLDAVEEARRFQPRELSLNDTRAAQYAFAMRRGDEFPPIKVANVGGKLYVVDGFHRLEAARQAKRTQIAAEIAPMSEKAAVALAINANALHGLPLSQKDKQRCFQLYRDAGLHCWPDGRVKSLRQIRKDLGNLAWPNTISSWLKKANIEPEPDDEGPNVSWQDAEDPDHEPTDEVDTMDSLTTFLSGLANTYQTLESPENRYAIRERLRLLLRELEAEEGTSAPDAYAYLQI